MEDDFYPKLMLDNVKEITHELLVSNNIKGLILDIDNTLVPNHVAEVDDDTLAWIDKIKASGIKLCIVSNGAKKRVVKFNDKLKLDAVHRALKPRAGAFEKARRIMGLESRNIAVIGDQIFTDVYGGNKAGMFTILVKPIDKREGMFVRLKRIPEKRILKGFEKASSKKENRVE